MSQLAKVQCVTSEEVKDKGGLFGRAACDSRELRWELFKIRMDRERGQLFWSLGEDGALARRVVLTLFSLAVGI